MVNYVIPRDAVTEKLGRARALLDQELATAGEVSTRASTRRNRGRLAEFALVLAHEAWEDFQEALFLRCLHAAQHHGTKARFEPRFAKLVLSGDASDNLDKAMRAFRDDAFPSSFGVARKVRKAADTWFAPGHPFEWLTPFRQALLDGVRLLRNDIAHGDAYSTKTQGAMNEVFAAGRVPQKAQGRRPGDVLRSEGVKGHGNRRLVDVVLDEMDSGAGAMTQALVSWA